MKLLHCLECGDIKALISRKRQCLCKKSSGAYMKDGLFAWYKGPCRIIGLRNQDVLRSQTEKQVAYETSYPWFVCLGHVVELI